MKNPWTNILAAIIWVAPIIYLLTVYSSLPEIVPLHYNMEGEPDAVGKKSELIVIQIVISFMSGGVYLLIKNGIGTNGEEKQEYSPATLNKLAMGILVFMSVICIAIALDTVYESFSGTTIFFPASGLLLAFIGSSIQDVKPTHKFTGRLWLISGITLAIVVLFLPALLTRIVFGLFIITVIVIPLIYSYRYNKKQLKE
ncbi:MAG: DUF1648 domain-containing protein [Sphingobacteriaceae bacterium]|nr:MAG: DUF1648 domain-containing protein [Sphingobacteriaceae bacterium]